MLFSSNVENSSFMNKNNSNSTLIHKTNSSYNNKANYNSLENKNRYINKIDTSGSINNGNRNRNNSISSTRRAPRPQTTQIIHRQQDKKITTSQNPDLIESQIMNQSNNNNNNNNNNTSTVIKDGEMIPERLKKSSSFVNKDKYINDFNANPLVSHTLELLTQDKMSSFNNSHNFESSMIQFTTDRIRKWLEEIELCQLNSMNSRHNKYNDNNIPSDYCVSDYDSIDEKNGLNRVVDKTFHIVHDENIKIKN
jgi:hypothetical protein